jgi:UPF0716 protein FxsA
MWFGLFLIFVAAPLLELALLIKVGGVIGFWPTIAIIILTAGLGVAVIQSHGVRVMQQAMATLAQGGMPVRAVADNTFILLAGLLLILPGLATDLLGLLLLIPPLRHVISQWGMRKLLVSGRVHTWTAQAGGTQSWPKSWPQEPRRPAQPFDAQGPGEPDIEAEPVAKPWPKSKAGRGATTGPSHASGGPVIDGEFERIDEKAVDLRKSKDER